jgi:hypothetical protein
MARTFAEEVEHLKHDAQALLRVVTSSIPEATETLKDDSPLPSAE